MIATVADGAVATVPTLLAVTVSVEPPPVIRLVVALVFKLAIVLSVDTTLKLSAGVFVSVK